MYIFSGNSSAFFPAETGQVAKNIFPCRAELPIELANILTFACRTSCILEKTKPKIVHITLPCQSAEEAAATIKNESNFGAHFNFQGIIYFSPEQSNAFSGPHVDEDSNRLSLCNILYVLSISSSMAFQILIYNTRWCHVARCGAVC
jgi:hypothetical protein